MWLRWQGVLSRSCCKHRISIVWHDQRKGLKKTCLSGGETLIKTWRVNKWISPLIKHLNIQSQCGMGVHQVVLLPRSSLVWPWSRVTSSPCVMCASSTFPLPHLPETFQMSVCSHPLFPRQDADTPQPLLKMNIWMKSTVCIHAILRACGIGFTASPFTPFPPDLLSQVIQPLTCF